MNAALEQKKTRMGTIISNLESKKTQLERERNRVIASEIDTAAMAKVVGEECFNNTIEQIRFLNPRLHIKTEGMNPLLNVVSGQMVEIIADDNIGIENL